MAKHFPPVTNNVGHQESSGRDQAPFNKSHYFLSSPSLIIGPQYINPLSNPCDSCFRWSTAQCHIFCENLRIISFNGDSHSWRRLPWPPPAQLPFG